MEGKSSGFGKVQFNNISYDYANTYFEVHISVITGRQNKYIIQMQNNF